MTKLFIQIPCLNEEGTISRVISSIPKAELKKLNLETTVVIIDDGSTDNTAQKAQEAGADFILKNNTNLGLAKSFSKGLKYCLKQGADIIVNTDGDNQYNQEEVLKLIQPILDGKAGMVIGDRQINILEHMPPNKKFLNTLGSSIIRWLTGLEVPDASSGFRAFSRETALSFNLHSNHTYTHETIIQAKELGLKVVSVPITFNKRVSGESRLISSVTSHLQKSLSVIVKTILFYKAFKYLLITGLIVITAGLAGLIRFLYFFLAGNGTGHIQSVVLSAVLIILGFIIITLGIVADLISVNRKILEEIKIELQNDKSSR